MDRTRGVGVMSRENALRYGFTGPCLRGSGVQLDILTGSRRDFAARERPAWQHESSLAADSDLVRSRCLGPAGEVRTRRCPTSVKSWRSSSSSARLHTTARA